MNRQISVVAILPRIAEQLRLAVQRFAGRISWQAFDGGLSSSMHEEGPLVIERRAPFLSYEIEMI